MIMTWKVVESGVCEAQVRGGGLSGAFEGANRCESLQQKVDWK